MIQDSVNQMLGSIGAAAAVGKHFYNQRQAPIEEAKGMVQKTDSDYLSRVSELKKMNKDMTPEAIGKLSPTERADAIARYQDLNSKLVDSKMIMGSAEYGRNLRKAGKDFELASGERAKYLAGEENKFDLKKYGKDLEALEGKGFGYLKDFNREAIVGDLDKRFGIQTSQNTKFTEGKSNYTPPLKNAPIPKAEMNPIIRQQAMMAAKNDAEMPQQQAKDLEKLKAILSSRHSKGANRKEALDYIEKRMGGNK